MEPLLKQGGTKQVNNCQEAALDEQNIDTFVKKVKCLLHRTTQILEIF